MFAQDDLFGTPKKEAKRGLVIVASGSFNIPAADMAKRFGLGYSVGPGFFYKTQKNWLFGATCDFLFGNRIKEDSFMINLKEANGGIIGQNGQRTSINIFERGYMIGLQAGKIIPFNKKNRDNGLMLMTSAGFIQHKILINDPQGHVTQVQGDYRKGYDRLTNGWYLGQFIGYTYFSNSGLVNFNIGLNATFGFTQGRRDYLLDVRRPGTDSRTDIIIGIRGGWYIPIFKRKSEEYYFE